MGFLRLFLAYVVLLSHAPEGLILKKILHPALAVQCFYAISGFYIQLLISQYQIRKNNWVFDFYKSRLLRIFPTYLICLGLTIMLNPKALSQLGSLSLSHQILFVVNNLLIFPQVFLRFFHVPYTLMGQSWTLSLEMMFYLLSPFLLTKNNRVLILTILLSICIRLTLRDYNLYTQEWFYNFFPSEIAIFTSGALAYRFYDNFLKNQSGVYEELLKGLGLVLLIYLIYFYLRGWHYVHGGHWELEGKSTCGVPWGYWYALFLTILSIPFIFKWSKNIKIDRFIGEFSYPVYLSHFMIIEFLYSKVSDGYLNITALIITLIVSYFITQYIELPLAKYRTTLRRNDNVSDAASNDMLPAGNQA